MTERQKQTKNKSTELIGIICDILASSEFVPSKDKLEVVKNEIHKYWDNSARKLLEDIVIEENPEKELAEYIEFGLINSLCIKLHNFFEKQSPIIRNTIGRLISFIGISISEFVVRKKAEKLSFLYSKEVQSKASNLFKLLATNIKKTLKVKLLVSQILKS